MRSKCQIAPPSEAPRLAHNLVWQLKTFEWATSLRTTLSITRTICPSLGDCVYTFSARIDSDAKIWKNIHENRPPFAWQSGQLSGSHSCNTLGIWFVPTSEHLTLTKQEKRFSAIWIDYEALKSQSILRWSPGTHLTRIWPQLVDEYFMDWSAIKYVLIGSETLVARPVCIKRC